MCLYTINREPKVAKHDIVCYKWIVPLSETKCESPCVRAKLKRHKLNYAIGSWEINPAFVIYGEYSYGYWIGRGFIHAYKEKKYPDFISYECKLVKCIIPKGTDYFEDKYEICATKMIIDVKENKFLTYIKNVFNK